MAVCAVLQLDTFRSIAVCLLLITGGSAARDHGPCKFIPNTSSLRCPCTMSWPLNAEQILRLHNLRQFQDNCTRGKDNELHCQIASQARVEAAGVTLKLQGVPGIVFCEIYNNTSSVECPRQRTQVDWLSIPPQKTSQTPVSTETDGRRVWDTTTNTHVRIVIPVVVGVSVLVVLIVVLWRQRRRMCRRVPV
ncbi:uncharacterized protein LOC134350231 isoform X2 [Mobula hypostoma]|uniref:uncharacterized protein LOC134350231 isoform X2 n=1 Tax=Mobula hypostoma TaxID=723540 RepID=UPI002FC28E83